MTEGPPRTPPRTPTAALQRALVVGSLAVGAGLVAGRADVALIGLPLLAGAWLALSGGGRPGMPTVEASWPRTVQQSAEFRVRVHVRSAGAELVTLRLATGEDFPHGSTVAVAGGDRELTTRVTVAGRGRVVVSRPDVLALSADGLVAIGPLMGSEYATLALPAHDRVPATPLPPRPSGLVGGHRTRRPGEGAELFDIREYQPGDRVRRIDWRVSARRGSLHVRRTAIDADATVLLYLDSRVDVGHDASLWARPPGRDRAGRGVPGSSLDLAIRAATSLAATHLRLGDRVGLVDFSTRHRWLRPGTGRRQFIRMQLRLAATQAAPRSAAQIPRRDRVPAGAVVVVLSPFLDDVPVDAAIDASRQGARVLAVDCLPEPIVPDPTVEFFAEALDAVLAEQRQRCGLLRAQGVAVMGWDSEIAGAALQRWARTARWTGR